MKLATVKDGTRDGTLIVVARDLEHAIKADDIAPTLQAALNDWSYASPQLTDRHDALDRARGSRAVDFDAKQCASPLPRENGRKGPAVAHAGIRGRVVPCALRARRVKSGP